MQCIQKKRQDAIQLQQQMQAYQTKSTTEQKRDLISQTRSLLPIAIFLRDSASSFHWLSSSIFSFCRLVGCPASVTSPLSSTIWCFRAYKPYIFCEDMILATCQCQHIFCCWVEPSLLLSSFMCVFSKYISSREEGAPSADVGNHIDLLWDCSFRLFWWLDPNEHVTSNSWAISAKSKTNWWYFKSPAGKCYVICVADPSAQNICFC